MTEPKTKRKGVAAARLRCPMLSVFRHYKGRGIYDLDGKLPPFLDADAKGLKNWGVGEARGEGADDGRCRERYEVGGERRKRGMSAAVPQAHGD
jgi:hypothetical protein